MISLVLACRDHIVVIVSGKQVLDLLGLVAMRLHESDDSHNCG